MSFMLLSQLSNHSSSFTLEMLIYMDIKITGITGIIQLSMTGAKFF